jgi:HSP20 family protein
MSIVKRHNDLFSLLPNLFDDFAGRDLFNWNSNNYSFTGTTLPAVNIRETDSDFLVEMAAPGMLKENFRVELENNVLTISSEHKEENHDQNKEHYQRREFSYQTFQRTFTLPKEVVDSDKIHAKYENGLLRLVIPKREEARKKAPRIIKIS